MLPSLRPCTNRIPLRLASRANVVWRARHSTKPTYTCDLDEEPIAAYRHGGYHPVHIGDRAKDDRYKILHKVGWGGFSTVWAARDTKNNRNVALKIMQAAASRQSRERETLAHLCNSGSQHPGARHMVHLHDDFDIDGPNGSHECLVMDLTGPSIQEYINRHVEDGRLPGPLAKSFARQSLQALSYMHGQEIGHGDVHLRNLTVGIPEVADMSEAELYSVLGEPTSEPVSRTDDRAHEPGVPKALVKPATFAVEDHLELDHVQLVDFGASFHRSRPAQSLMCPPIIRAPEAFFGDTLDTRADLWSMGCTLFELICGQTPFEVGNDTAEAIAKQMLFTIPNDDFPQQWQAKRQKLESNPPSSRPASLQQWMQVVYFEREDVTHLSKDDIDEAGELIARLLRFDPGNRASADEILRSEWLQK